MSSVSCYNQHTYEKRWSSWFYLANKRLEYPLLLIYVELTGLSAAVYVRGGKEFVCIPAETW